MTLWNVPSEILASMVCVIFLRISRQWVAEYRPDVRLLNLVCKHFLTALEQFLKRTTLTRDNVATIASYGSDARGIHVESTKANSPF